MTFRCLTLCLAFQTALLAGNLFAGHCSRPSQSYAAPQTTYYAAPQATYYAAPQATYYTAPQATQFVAAQASTPVVMLAAQSGTSFSAQSSSFNCAGASSQGAESQSFMTQLVPLLLPKIVDRMFPDTPPSSSDVNSRLNRIEDRLDRLEAVVFKKKGDDNENGLDPVPPPGEASTEGIQQIIHGISQIQSKQKDMANHLMAMDANIQRNATNTKKIQSFLLAKYENEFKNHQPPVK